MEITVDGKTVQVEVTSKCFVCGHETDSYFEARTHIDANEGHYYVSICR